MTQADKCRDAIDTYDGPDLWYDVIVPAMGIDMFKSRRYAQILHFFDGSRLHYDQDLLGWVVSRPGEWV